MKKGVNWIHSPLLVDLHTKIPNPYSLNKIMRDPKSDQFVIEYPEGVPLFVDSMPD